MKTTSKPVIFIGSGRSGSTVISEIVFRHEQLAWPSNYQDKFPAVTAVNWIRNIFENPLWHIAGQKPQLNKVSFINKIIFKPVEAYNFWEYITGDKIDFSRGFLLNNTATPDEADRIHRIFLNMIRYQCRQRLSFKITGPSRMGYLLSIFPDALFINIVRDPFYTIQSWLKVDFWQDKGMHQLWWQGAYTDAEENWASKNAANPYLLAALQYRKIQEVTEAEIRQHNAHCLTIAYEDFVANPEKILQEIFTFTGLPVSRQIEKYLQKNKIYNQNKRSLSADTEMMKVKDTMDQILAGNFHFN